MKLSIAKFIFIILITQGLVSAKLMIDDMGGIQLQSTNGGYIAGLKGTIIASIKKQIQELFKGFKSPKGYQAPNICIWKICSKPLKNATKARKQLVEMSKIDDSNFK